MKLAFICTELLPCPAIRGGAIQTLIDGVTPILGQKHDLTIFCVRDPNLPNREKRDGIQYIRLPSKNYAREVAKELAKHDFDVIHVFNRPVNVPMYKAAASKSRIVLSLHNEMFAKGKISYRLGLKAIRSVEKIMTVSDYIGKTVTGRFSSAQNKIQTVYSGADLSAYVPVWSSKGQEIRAKIRKKMGLKGKKVILFVGRLSRVKGPHLLIKAMNDIKTKHKKAVLVIIGGRWFSDNRVDRYVRYLHKLAKPLKDRVIFTKYVPADKLPAYYLAGHVFVCSSQWQEPLARVHYEAMAAGIPLITTKRGGNAEIVNHKFNGLVVEDYNNPKAFAKAIDFLLSNRDRAGVFARNGRSFVESNFQFKHVAERLEKVYLEALGVEESE
ncbi:glycosyltransferase family 4 protein [Effusibacillus consociatus]|uniref:Glycosyltransferase family 4 protein n=1 Tax=Effusibacillus consociatus TaxID=1117041 RepID=A0ABV9Q473_9BACL